MPNGTSLNQSNLAQYQSSTRLVGTVLSTNYYPFTVSYGRYDMAEIV